jgi:hypothetical protein
VAEEKEIKDKLKARAAVGKVSGRTRAAKAANLKDVADPEESAVEDAIENAIEDVVDSEDVDLMAGEHGNNGLGKDSDGKPSNCSYEPSPLLICYR